jgi:DNA invertase Pin-like site-specific DNA recombinase
MSKKTSAASTALGLTVGEVYREELSGRLFRERQALNHMRSRYLNGTIQGIVVTSLDRLSRSLLHLVMLVNEMEERQIALHVVQDRLEDSVQGKWLLALSAFL